MAEKHLIRIADWGVTEQTVIFADDFVLDRLPADGDVLDIGCGRGVFDAKAAQRVRSVTGIDITPSEIEAALTLCSDANIRFFVHDAEKLSEFEGSYDAVYSRFCFHHLNMDKAAEGIHARLKPGGRLIAVDCLEDYWKLSGSFFILLDATRRIGVVRMITLIPRLLFFFTPKRFQHVKSDIARIKSEKRYHFEDFKNFYTRLFPGAQIGMIGCAAYIDWRKP
ncbi:MAG: class I SAM-dependent methyltransferase [Deltaproteobacteria bacterium]|nr:class I SAM-dependent methyltransferase [Deltaproteobacteria bacterium]